jgi:hypothetical protein
VQALLHRAEFVEAEARVEPGCVDTARGEEVDLVLHQRNQRRHDHREAVQHQRRELVAEALTAAGRKDRERRAAVQECVDDLLLAGAERREAEPLGKDAER